MLKGYQLFLSKQLMIPLRKIINNIKQHYQPGKTHKTHKTNTQKDVTNFLSYSSNKTWAKWHCYRRGRSLLVGQKINFSYIYTLQVIFNKQLS